MHKKEPKIRKRESRPRCPVCGRLISVISEIRGLGLQWEDVILPHSGDLTQCDCGAMLEYAGDPASLTLSPARPDRIKAFNYQAAQADPEPSLPELVAYIMKYRRMPRRPPTARFRRAVHMTALQPRRLQP